MSRIIRSTNAQSTEEKPIVEIKLHSFFEPIHYGDTAEELVDDTPQLTLEEIQQERQMMLLQAEQEIEQQKRQFDQFRDEQLQTVEALKQMWEE